MATRKEAIAFILQELGTHGQFAARPMFGEYALYAYGKTVALVCDDLLYVKIMPESAALQGCCEIGQPYPGARPHYIVTEDQLSLNGDLACILRDIAAALPAPKPKARRRRA